MAARTLMAPLNFAPSYVSKILLKQAKCFLHNESLDMMHLLYSCFHMAVMQECVTGLQAIQTPENA
jgi:hypothetical protein